MELETSSVAYKDFAQMCRLCLSTQRLCSIYLNSAILKFFQSITDIEVKPDDNLPKNICKGCLKKLEDIDEFIKKCVYNDNVLKTLGLQFLQNKKEDESSVASLESESTQLEKFKEEVADSMENIIFEIEDEIDEPNPSDISLSEEIKNDNVKNPLLLRDELDNKEVFPYKFCGKRFKKLGNIKNHVDTHNDNISPTCSLCNESFSNLAELSKHNCSFSIIDDTVKKKMKLSEHCECMYCKETFTKVGDLLRHVRTHLGTKLFECTMCDKKFTQKSALNRHVLLHTGKFKCDTCDTPFTRESQLQSHIEKAHNAEKGSDMHKCKFCSKSYSTKLYLTIHLKSHVKVGAFQCQMCDKVFSLKSLLNRHSMSHPEYKKFKCDKCKKGFRSVAAYRQHMKWHKQGLVGNLACNGCGKMYRRPGNLKDHMALCHKSNSAPAFLCATCGKNLPTKRHLLNHVRTHRAKIRQYQCDMCGNNFAYKDSLDQHLMSHKGEKPYKCTHCNKSFQRTSYYRHLKIHKNVREHKCKHCDKSFYRSDLLKQHMARHKE